MKSMARAVLFTSIVAATGAAVGDMLSTAIGESDKEAAASSMPADPQASPMVSTESTAATSPEGASADLAASSTYALPQPNEYTTVTPSPSTDMVAANPPAEGMAPAPRPVEAMAPAPRPVEAMAPTPRPAEPVARRASARPAWFVARVSSTFPASGDDPAYNLVPKSTYADLWIGKPSVRVAGSVFPASGDDPAYNLVPKSTYADLYLGRPVQVARSQRPLDSSGN